MVDLKGKLMVAKNGAVPNAETAKKVGVEGGVEFDHRINPGEVLRCVQHIG